MKQQREGRIQGLPQDRDFEDGNVVHSHADVSLTRFKSGIAFQNMLIPEFINMHLPAGSLRARMAKGTFWTLVGSVIAQGAGMVGSIFCARILGKVGFGELGMIRSTVLMFGVLAGTGLGIAATKYAAEFRVKDPIKAGRMIGLFMNTAIILGGSVTLVCLIIAAPLAKWAMNAPHLAGVLQVGCILLLLNTLNGVQLGAVCGFEAFRTQSLVIILDGIFNLVLIPAGAFIYGVIGAVGGSVTAALLGFIVKQWAMNKECKRANIKISHRNVSSEFPELWKFVLPAALVGVSIQPFEWVSRLMLVQQPNGYAELGIFTAVFTWAQLIVFLPGQISGPIMPIMSNLLASGQIKQLKKLIVTSQYVMYGLAFASAVVLSLLSPYILRAYGSEFVSGRLALLTIIAAYVISIGSSATRSLFAATGHMWWQTIQTLVWGIVLIISAMFFVRYGGIGLAVSYLCANTVVIILQLSTQYVFLKSLSN